MAASDPYLNIANADAETLNKLTDFLESRAADTKLIELRDKILAETFEGLENASVLEVGCGTGPILRRVLELPQVDKTKVHGIDPSGHFCTEGKKLCEQIVFLVGYSTEITLPDNYLDVIIYWTTMNHIPADQREESMKEVKRALKPGGRCLLFDNDCCNWSCAIGPDDPIQESIGRHIERYISDPIVCQKMPGLLSMVGLKPQELKIDEIVDSDVGSYGHGMVDRALTNDAKQGSITEERLAELKADLGVRVAEGKFKMQLTYGHCIGIKE